MKSRSLALVLLAFIAAALFSGAAHGVAATDGLQLQITGVDLSAYPKVRFVVVAIDGSGRPVANLGSKDFSVNVGEKKIPVAGVQSLVDAKVGVSSLLVIDTSGSMAGASLTAARDAATLFVNAQTTQDEVGLLTFADGVTTASVHTNDFAGVRSALGRLVARGNTALYQAVADAATAASSRSFSRKVVLLLSDGEEFGNLSRVNREQSLEIARGSGVVFFAIGLGAQIDRDYLRQLADSTGGRFFVAPTSAQLRTVFSDVAGLLRTQYVVTLDVGGTGVQGDVTAHLVVTAGASNGETDIPLSLPIVIPEAVELPPPPPAPVSPGTPAWVYLLPLIALACLVGWLFIRRRANRPVPMVPSQYAPPPVFDILEPTAPEAAKPRRVLGHLKLGDGTSYELDDSLITIGTRDNCTYKLPISEADFGQGDLRIWQTNGRILIRDTAARPRLRVNGRPVGWTFLGDHDQIEIRGLRFEFELARSADNAIP